MKPARDRTHPGPPAGPFVAFACLIGFLGLLTATVGLDARAWLVGAICGIGMTALLSRAMTGHGRRHLEPADRVTLTRAVLACGIAALTVSGGAASGRAPIGPASAGTASTITSASHVAAITALAAIGLILDGVDGRIARRTGTASPFGARFDFEVDAFLILVLSVYVSREWGWWVLALGLARYAYIAASWWVPWLRVSPPPRAWAKVVAVFVAVVLVLAVSSLLPDPVTLALLVLATLMLAESFGNSIWHQWRQSRHAAPTAPTPQPASTPVVLAVLVLWVALLMPDRWEALSPGAFLHIPVEGIAFVALALALPVGAAQVVALVAGVTLSLLTILRLIDVGFHLAYDTPFHPVDDLSYVRPGLDLLTESVGPAGSAGAVLAAALLAVALVILIPLAAWQLTRYVCLHRRPAIQAVGLLAAIAVVTSVAGTLWAPAGSVASLSAAGNAYSHVWQARDDLVDARRFTVALAEDDPWAAVPESDLLRGLHGRDVLLVVVESYGRSALGLPEVSAALDLGEERLRSAGWQSRSGWLRSPTFGGKSWLAHSTLQSGLWVDSQRRYDDLLTDDRMTLTQAFSRAGWRAVVDAPALAEDWPVGSSFYGFDQVYDRRNVGYIGPGFTWGAMPDQYTLAALHRLELDVARPRPAVMAQVNLVSSHWPWPPPPHLLGWDRVGDGTAFNDMPASSEPADGVLHDPVRARAAYAAATAYSLDSVTSFIADLVDRDTVLVVLGDHQPSSLVTGQGASRDVPVSIVAADSQVIDRASAWGWGPGLRPHDPAPAWPMDEFRDRFLTAFAD